MADRLRVGACRLLSRPRRMPRGCWSSAPARSARSWRRPIRRCGRSAKSASGTGRAPMPRRRRRRCAATASTPSGRRSRCRAWRGRHRFVRDHFRRPAGQGRAAEARRPCRPGRRLHATACARPTTTRSGAPASMSIPAPAPPRRPATSCSRSPRACLTPTPSSPTCTSWRAAKSAAAQCRRDHAVQIGGRRARGSRGGHCRLPQIGRPHVGGQHAEEELS